jgi:hypothetical protein
MERIKIGVPTIDQSQLLSTTTDQLGSNATKQAQQFLSDVTHISKITCRRGSSTGIFPGNILISIQGDDGNNNPDGVPISLFPVVIQGSTWLAFPENTDFDVPIYARVQNDGITKYWLVYESTTSDVSNFTRLRVTGTQEYTKGVWKSFSLGSWSSPTSRSSYFKIHGGSSFFSDTPERTKTEARTLEGGNRFKVRDMGTGINMRGDSGDGVFLSAPLNIPLNSPITFATYLSIEAMDKIRLLFANYFTSGNQIGRAHV